MHDSWRYVEELCDLFGMGDTPSRRDFVALIDCAAWYEAHGMKRDISDLASELSKELGQSTVVFWSRLKRCAKPLLDAAPETLTALGVPCGKRCGNTSELCRKIVAAVKDDELYSRDYSL